MLKGIPSNVSSDLLKALADMGHGDMIVIADDFYPSITKTPNGLSIHAKGNTAAEMVASILKLMPLDTEYCEYPALHICPDADSGIDMEQNDVWDEVKQAVKESGYDVSCVGKIERMKFYEKAAGAYVTLSTSEQRPYGCFILQKGVM